MLVGLLACCQKGITKLVLLRLAPASAVQLGHMHHLMQLSQMHPAQQRATCLDINAGLLLALKGRGWMHCTHAHRHGHSLQNNQVCAVTTYDRYAMISGNKAEGMF